MLTLVVILGGDALFFVVPCSMHGIVHVSISTLEIAKRALLDHYGELRLMFGDEWVTTILEAKQIVVYPGMYLAYNLGPVRESHRIAEYGGCLFK